MTGTVHHAPVALLVPSIENRCIENFYFFETGKLFIVMLFGITEGMPKILTLGPSKERKWAIQVEIIAESQQCAGKTT